MDANHFTSLHCGSTSGSMVPITPYEIWQLNKYGNFIKEKSDYECMDYTWLERKAALQPENTNEDPSDRDSSEIF